VSTSIVEYTETDSALAELRNKYQGVVYDVAKFKHMQEAKSARAELREKRVALEKMRVSIKAPALERCRQIDSEAKRITGELLALESPIDEQIKAEEHRKEREKAAKEEAEREAQARIQARFDEVKGFPLQAVGKTPAQISELIEEANLLDGQFDTEVQTAAFKFEQGVAIAALKTALERQMEAEAEAERIKAERAELERLRAEQEAVRAEADRLAREERDRQAAEARRLEEIARAEREAKERAEREAREIAERAARQAREEEQRRIDAERAEARRIEDAEREAAAKKLRQEQEDAARERARLEAEKKAQAKREREQAIANATLHAAATEALELLREEGFGDHLVTLKLASALSRESQKKVA
jgi:hypothetical protein